MLTAIYQPLGWVFDSLLEKLRSPRPKSWAAILVMIGAVFCCFPPDARSQTDDIVRVGFTKKMFTDISENDVLAVTRIWTQMLFQEGKIAVPSESVLFDNVWKISAALSSGKVDGLLITAAEFAQVQELIDEDVILCSIVSGSVTEEYLLMVNRKSNIQQLSDLKGRTLGMLTTRQTTLAATWLDTVLLRDGLGPAAGLFDRIDKDPNVGKLLVPLFFGQVDACVVTRKAFDTMVELNPQTGKQLEILESSPPVVPMIFCFRKDFVSPIKKQAVDEILSWNHSSDRKQSLTLFQVDRMEKQPISCLDSAMALISEYQRLLGESSAGVTGN